MEEDSIHRRNTGELVQEFLALNRRRLSNEPPLSAAERERWVELRWQLEAALGGGAAGQGPERCALRVPTDLEVCFSDPQREQISNAKEIAEGGLFLATEQPPACGTPLRLRIESDGGEVVAVEGVVVWVRARASALGPPGMGVQFENLDASQHEAVAYLVEQALAAL